MEIRALARLVVVTAVAGGTLAFSYDLGNAATATGSGSVSQPGGRLDADAQTGLEQAGAEPSGEPVDESRPHSHIVDPETGGLISVEGASGILPAAADLGPIHIDPFPAGVDLSDPTDTRSLLRRAGDLQTAGDPAAPAVEVPAGATAPAGTPGVSSLGSHVAPSCAGTGTDGNRVQVLYVHESSTPSRYTEMLPVLLDEVANVDDVFAVSSAQTGGGRRVRWVQDAECVPVVVDVTVGAGDLGPDFITTIEALEARGYDHANRKYMIFADANEFCGIGTLYRDQQLTDNRNDGYAASYARVDANCWSTAHSVPAHELTHNLGGVQLGAPHATARGHCFDERDLMCYDDGSNVPMRQVCAGSQEQLLDCNHDDYFSTRPPAGTFLARNWNTASSSFLDTVPALGTTAWSSPRVAGRRISSTLRSSSGPLARTAAVLQVRWYGAAAWVTVRNLVTGSTGVATAGAAYPRAGTFRFSYAGVAGQSGSRSSGRYVKVSTKVAARGTQHRVAATLRTVSGRPIARARLVLQRRPFGGHWARVTTARTDRRGAAARPVDPRRSSYYRWVYRGEAVHAGSLSPRLTVRR